MTRESARKNLVAMGIAEPTDEQITVYLNQVQGETKIERERADKYKDDAQKASDLQKQLDEISNQNLNDIERANKERDTALNRVGDLENQLKQMQLIQSLAEHGIVGEDAKNLMKDGELSVETLAKILTEKTTKAAADKEKELLARTPNPNGDNGGGSDDKTAAEKLVESVFGANASGANNDIIGKYINN